MYLSRCDEVFIIMYSKTQNVVVMAEVETLFVRLLVEHDSHSCSVEHNLVGLCVEKVVASVVPVVPVKNNITFILYIECTLGPKLN